MWHNLGGDDVYSFLTGPVFGFRGLNRRRKTLVLAIGEFFALTVLSYRSLGIWCFHDPAGIQRGCRIFCGGLGGSYCRSRIVE